MRSRLIRIVTLLSNGRTSYLPLAWVLYYPPIWQISFFGGDYCYCKNQCCPQGWVCNITSLISWVDTQSPINQLKISQGDLFIHYNQTILHPHKISLAWWEVEVLREAYLWIILLFLCFVFFIFFFLFPFRGSLFGCEISLRGTSHHRFKRNDDVSIS